MEYGLLKMAEKNQGAGASPASIAVTIEKFDARKSSLAEWLRSFEARLDLYKIASDADRILWCCAYVGLDGEDLLLKLPRDTTWETARKALKDGLGGGGEVRDAWKQLRTLRRGDKTLASLKAEAYRLATTACPDVPSAEQMASEAFLQAIDGDLAEELQRIGVTTLRKLLDDAERLEALNQRKKEQRNNRVYEDRGPSSHEQLLQGQIRALTERMQQMQLAFDTPRVARAQAEEPPRRRIRCFFCDQEGHIIRNCALKQEALQALDRRHNPQDGRALTPQTKLN